MPLLLRQQQPGLTEGAGVVSKRGGKKGDPKRRTDRTSRETQRQAADKRRRAQQKAIERDRRDEQR